MLQCALRLGYIDLQHLFPRAPAGIGYGKLHAGLGHAVHFHRKVRVAQAVAEGIAGLHALLIKPAIANIDILGVFLVFQIAVAVAEGIGAGIVVIADRPCVCQAAAGAGFSGQDVRQRIAALHAPLSEKQHCIHWDLVQNGQIHHAAAVEDQHQLLVVFPQQPQAFGFYIGQEIVALFHSAILSFSRLPGKDINGSVCFIR